MYHGLKQFSIFLENNSFLFDGEMFFSNSVQVVFSCIHSSVHVTIAARCHCIALHCDNMLSRASMRCLYTPKIKPQLNRNKN